MLAEQLNIYNDTFLLIKQMYLYYNNVRKEIRYGIYGDAISMTLNALDLIYVANSDKSKRYNALIKYLQLIGGVRSRVRLCGELKFISVKLSTTLMKMIDKVCKLATGWKNSII